MERIPVSSSMLLSIGYDVDSGTLEIEFSPGVVWQYFDVPENVWEEFKVSGSHGKYFHASIKKVFRQARVG